MTRRASRRRDLRTPADRGLRAERLLHQLATAGMRMTDQRTRLVCAIADRHEPFGPERLADELRIQGIGRATVYRTLDRLEQLGVLARVDVGTSHGYTVCEDACHHHHLVCRGCRMVVPIDAGAIEQQIERLAQRLRFR